MTVSMALLGGEAFGVSSITESFGVSVLAESGGILLFFTVSVGEGVGSIWAFSSVTANSIHINTRIAYLKGHKKRV
jgi:hypothetical protein